MYIKRILLLIVALGLVFMASFSFYVYKVMFKSNTSFEEDSVFIFIKTGTTYDEMLFDMKSYLKNIDDFDVLAKRKKYFVKPGKYIIKKDMNNNDIVFDIIKKSKKHLTAYEILDKFQKFKKIQPMAVYRSLKKLIEEDKIHKSNQNKTYVLCSHEHVKHNPSIAICRDCGDTEELNSELFETIFKKNPIKKYDFNKFQLEVSTICRRCN